VIDSIAAIRHMDSSEFMQIFGLTSVRLLTLTYGFGLLPRLHNFSGGLEIAM